MSACGVFKVWVVQEAHGEGSDGASYIESFNGRLRDECLNVHQFLSLLPHAQQQLDTWRSDGCVSVCKTSKARTSEKYLHYGIALYSIRTLNVCVWNKPNRGSGNYIIEA